ncbi:ankyrin, partial [Morchella conica CCBAS932]
MGYQDLVTALLENGADVNRKSIRPVYNDEWKYLVKRDRSFELKTLEFSDNNSVANELKLNKALQYGPGVGYEKTISHLISEGDWQTASKVIIRRTPLQAAAEGGHLVIVNHLREKGADIETAVSGRHEVTALQAAAAGGHFPVVETLLDWGAYPDAEPFWFGGRSALQASAEQGDQKLVDLLLKRGAKLEKDLPARYFGRTVLQAATEKRHQHLVKYLLAVGADVCMSKEQHTPCLGGRTALQLAASNGDIELVNLFLEKGAGIGERQARLAGRTALQAAAENGHRDIVKRLVRYDKSMIDTGPSESYGRTALQAAAEGGHHAVVEFLLKEGVQNPFSPGSKYYGRTALQAAAGGGNLEIINILVKLRPPRTLSPDEIMSGVANHGGRNAIQAAAERGHLEVVKQLLQFAGGKSLPATIERPLPTSGDRIYAIEAAAAIGHEDLCKLLTGVELSIDPYSHPENEPYTRACQAASKAGHLHIYKLFRGQDLEALNAASVLTFAASNAHVEIVKLCLEDRNWPQAKMSEALCYASKRGSLPLVDLILSKQKFSQQQISYAISAAAGGNHLTIVDRLLRFNRSIDTHEIGLTEWSISALHSAAMGGYLSMCESLLERGAKLKQHATQTLMAAASCGRLDILKYLVEKLEQPAGTIADLNAALKAAAGAGHLGAVDYLLEQGADADHTGFTAHKIIQGNIVIKTITALGLASLNGHLSVVERLVGKKAHITSSAG